MRLIDADALIEELHHMIEGDTDLINDYKFLGIDDCIRSMPTAYDMEKVIAELEEKSMMVATSQKFYENPQNGEYVEEVIEIENAVSVVKRGGVE